MTCQHFGDLLQVVLDGELERLPAAAKRHMETCDACRATAAAFQQLRTAADELRLSSISAPIEAALYDRIERRIANAKMRQRSPLRFPTPRFLPVKLQPILATAVVALVLLLAYVFLRPEHTADQTALRSEDEIEVLLEEHTLQMESNLFQTTTLPSKLVSTVATVR